MTSLDPKIITREKGIETAKPIHPASWFRDTRLADLLSQARSRADDGQTGSNAVNPEDRPSAVRPRASEFADVSRRSSPLE